MSSLGQVCQLITFSSSLYLQMRQNNMNQICIVSHLKMWLFPFLPVVSPPRISIVFFSNIRFVVTGQNLKFGDNKQ